MNHHNPLRVVPLPVGQRVLIQPRRRRGKTKAEMIGTIEAVPGQSPFRAWVYYVRQDGDKVLGTYSDRQLTPITALDEMARL